MEGVEYEVHPEFTHLRVGTDGSVWTILGEYDKSHCCWSVNGYWTELKQYTNHSGYKVVSTSPSQSLRACQVHRLVLEAFVGPCPEGEECCHAPDPDPANNNLWNLRWDTPENNAADKAVLGFPVSRWITPKVEDSAEVKAVKREWKWRLDGELVYLGGDLWADNPLTQEERERFGDSPKRLTNGYDLHPDLVRSPTFRKPLKNGRSLETYFNELRRQVKVKLQAKGRGLR